MQCVTLDYFIENLKSQNITDIKELYFNDEFSCVSATINNRKSGIIFYTRMYPFDYNEFIKDNLDLIINTATDFFNIKEMDVYAVGVGLKNNHTSEEKSGIFEIGQKYNLYLGDFYSIFVAEKSNFGLSINNPILLENIPDEYNYMQKLESKFGVINNIERIGSFNSEKNNSHLIDKFEVEVVDRYDSLFVYKYYLYVDTYALDKFSDISKKVPVFFNWNNQK